MRAGWLKSGSICLAASPGGHLDVLRAVKPAIAEWRCAWITAAGSRSQSLATEEQTVYALPEWGRNPLRLLHNVARAFAVLVRERPGVVVTSGAGVVVPFCLLARAAGAKIAFAETMARVDDGSISGRLLSRLSSSVMVQWPETRRVYPTGTLCRPVLLENIRFGPAPVGRGTFVAVGTHWQPFDRLFKMIDCAVEAGILPTPVLAQTGISGYQPKHYEATPWLAPDELRARAASAEVVVCHAGSGVIAAALGAGRKPIVVPRRRALAEHTDDHQTQIAAKLAELGIAVAVDDEIGPEELDTARQPLTSPSGWGQLPSIGDVLARELRRLAGRAADLNVSPTPRLHDVLREG